MTAATSDGAIGRARILGLVDRDLAEVVQQRRHLEVGRVVRRDAERSPAIATDERGHPLRVTGRHDAAELGRHRERFDRLAVRTRSRSRAARTRTRPRAAAWRTAADPRCRPGPCRRRRGSRSPSASPTTRSRATPGASARENVGREPQDPARREVDREPARPRPRRAQAAPRRPSRRDCVSARNPSYDRDRRGGDRRGARP